MSTRRSDAAQKGKMNICDFWWQCNAHSLHHTIKRRVGHRLRELARGSQDAGSRNLGQASLTSPVKSLMVSNVDVHSGYQI